MSINPSVNVIIPLGFDLVSSDVSDPARQPLHLKGSSHYESETPNPITIFDVRQNFLDKDIVLVIIFKSAALNYLAQSGWVGGCSIHRLHLCIEVPVV